MKEQLTAVFEKVPEGYIAFVEKLPQSQSAEAIPRRKPCLTSTKRFNSS